MLKKNVRETGANPSVKTLQRLAEGMGMRVKVEFVEKERCV